MSALNLRAGPFALALAIGYPLWIVAVILLSRYAPGLDQTLMVLFVAAIATGLAAASAVAIWAVATHYQVACPRSRPLHVVILGASLAVCGIACFLVTSDGEPMREIPLGLMHSALCAGVFTTMVAIATWPRRARGG